MFTREQVHAVAALANLELDENEIEMFARQLGEILAYADEVQQVDTRGISPTASVLPLRTILRDDTLRPSLPRDELLANAPETEAGCFKVPAVLE